jgi:uncharacterized membrane protein
MIFKPLVILKSILVSSSSFKFLIVTVLALGLFFRFANLDQKIYWYDEAFTSLRISGYTEKVFNGREINVSDLQKFQHLNPERGLIDTVKGLATEEPQLPPLYFVILRFWVELFGDSVAVTRSLSAVISLLAFPCIYWLCRELFESPLVGWIIVLLMAVSPYHILFAQDARMYSLWSVTTLLSSASLLRAIRLKTKMGLATYTVTLVLGFYTHLLTLLTAIGHGLYVVIVGRFRLTKMVTGYLLAPLAGLLVFSPWILVLLNGITQAKKMTNADANTISLWSMVSSWIFQPSRIFLDLNVTKDSHYLSIFFASLSAIILFALIGYSIYSLYKTAPKSTSYFITILIIITPLILSLKGLFSGDARSTTLRYLIPSYMGVQIAVAYLLSRKIFGVSVNVQDRQFWQLATIAIVACGVISCAVSYQSSYWWNKGAFQNLQVAKIVNQSAKPLIVSSGVFSTDGSIVGNILSLSHVLDQKVRLILTVEPEVPTIPSSNYSDVFLYKPSASLIRRFEQEYEIEPTNGEDDVWLRRLIPRLH